MDESDDLAFTPLPCARRDGWTAERQRGFIEALSALGLVSAAARVVGMSAKSAYALRQRSGAESFADAWDRALDHGGDQAMEVAIRRAIHGVAVPVFYHGRQIGEQRRYNDKLLIAALRALGRRRAPPIAWGKPRWDA